MVTSEVLLPLVTSKTGSRLAGPVIHQSLRNILACHRMLEYSSWEGLKTSSSAYESNPLTVYSVYTMGVFRDGFRVRKEF